MRLKPHIRLALISAAFGLILLVAAVRYSSTAVIPMRLLGYEVRDDSVYAVLEVKNLSPITLFPDSIHYQMEEAYWRVSDTGRTRLTYNATVAGMNQALQTYGPSDIIWKRTNGAPFYFCLLRLMEGNDFYQLEHLNHCRFSFSGIKHGPAFGHQIRQSPLIPSLNRYRAANPAKKEIEDLSVRITE